MTATVPRPAPSWDTVRPARRGQGVLVTLGLLCLPPAVFATALRVFPPTADGPALLASFVSFGLLAYVPAFVVLLVALVRARRRIALGVVTALVATGLAYQVSTVAPMLVPDGRPVATPTFTVFSLNMQHGGVDRAELTAEARNADVVVLVEATPQAVAALEASGWRDRFPYASGATEDGGNGSVVFSRFPLRDSAPLPASSFQQWATTVDVPEVGGVRLLAVHPCNPLCGRGAWAREHTALRAAVADQDPDLPLIVAGDFNAVDDHGPMQQLYADGLTSATDLAGAGWLPTWPANQRIPPLLPIDHVLVDDRLTATAVGSVRLDGTDHLGLRAVLASTR